jgi:hypothetical protein
MKCASVDPHNYNSPFSDLENIINSLQLGIIQGPFVGNYSGEFTLPPKVKFDTTKMSDYTVQMGGYPYKSRSQFNGTNQKSDMPTIMLLQDFPYKVVSSSYGCNHDFGDTTAAQLSFNLNYKSFLESFGMTPQTQLQNPSAVAIINSFQTGTLIRDTHKLDKIWSDCTTQIDEVLSSINHSFPTLNTMFPKNGEKGEQDKHDVDVENVKKWLSMYSIDPKRIIWVVDTFHSWQDDITNNHLNMTNTISEIDAASANISGDINIETSCATSALSVNIGPIQISYNPTSISTQSSTFHATINLQGGPHLLLNAPQYVVDSDGKVLKNKLSVNKIIRYLNLNGIINLTNKYRKYTSDPSDLGCDVSFNDALLQQLAASFHSPVGNIKSLLLEYMKAAGDQAPLDILNCIMSQPGYSGKDLFMFSTGDLLAYQMAKSMGIPAFCLAGPNIRISLPTCLTSADIATNLLTQYLYAIYEYYFFTLVINDYMKKIEDKLHEMSQHSPALQIIAIQTIFFLNEYFQMIKKNKDKLFQAITYLRSDETIVDGLRYINNNFNDINFKPVQLYDLLFSYTYTDDDDDFIGYDTDFKKVSAHCIDLNIDAPSFNYCDEREYLNKPDSIKSGDSPFCVKDKNSEKIFMPKKTSRNPRNWINVYTYIFNKKCNKQEVDDIYERHKNDPRINADSALSNIEFLYYFVQINPASLPASDHQLREDVIKLSTCVSHGLLDLKLVSSAGKTDIKKFDEDTLDEDWLLVGEMYVVKYSRDSRTIVPFASQSTTPIPIPMNLIKEIAESSTLEELLNQLPYKAFDLEIHLTDNARIKSSIKTLSFITCALLFSLKQLLIDDTLIPDCIEYLLLSLCVCKKVDYSLVLLEPRDDNGRTQKIKGYVIDDPDKVIVSKRINKKSEYTSETVSNFLLFCYNHIPDNDLISFIKYIIDQENENNNIYEVVSKLIEKVENASTEYDTRHIQLKFNYYVEKFYGMIHMDLIKTFIGVENYPRQSTMMADEITRFHQKYNRGDIVPDFNSVQLNMYSFLNKLEILHPDIFEEMKNAIDNDKQRIGAVLQHFGEILIKKGVYKPEELNDIFSKILSTEGDVNNFMDFMKMSPIEFIKRKINIIQKKYPNEFLQLKLLINNNNDRDFVKSVLDSMVQHGVVVDQYDMLIKNIYLNEQTFLAFMEKISITPSEYIRLCLKIINDTVPIAYQLFEVTVHQNSSKKNVSEFFENLHDMNIGITQEQFDSLIEYIYSSNINLEEFKNELSITQGEYIILCLYIFNKIAPDVYTHFASAIHDKDSVIHSLQQLLQHIQTNGNIGITIEQCQTLMQYVSSNDYNMSLFIDYVGMTASDFTKSRIKSLRENNPYMYNHLKILINNDASSVFKALTDLGEEFTSEMGISNDDIDIMLLFTQIPGNENEYMNLPDIPPYEYIMTYMNKFFTKNPDVYNQMKSGIIANVDRNSIAQILTDLKTGIENNLVDIGIPLSEFIRLTQIIVDNQTNLSIFIQIIAQNGGSRNYKNKTKKRRINKRRVSKRSNVRKISRNYKNKTKKRRINKRRVSKRSNVRKISRNIMK